MHSTRPLFPDHADQASTRALPAPEVQAENTAAQPSAQEQIRRLAAGVVLGLAPLPAAIPIRRDTKITRAAPRRRRRTIARPSQAKSRPLAGHGQTEGSPETQAGQTGVLARTPARQTGAPGRADQSPRKDSGRAGLRLRQGRPESLRGLRQGRGRTLQGTGGGSHFPSCRSDDSLPPRDPFPRRCPMCRKRKRALKQHDKKTGERIERMLCGPCQRQLRIRERDRRCFSYHPIELDRPAPYCPLCSRRPRASKGTRRGRRRYFRLCAPCLRRDREERGLPAYRGAEGWRRREREEDLGRPRRIRHRRGRRIGPRPEWMSESIFDTDPADRPIEGRAAKEETQPTAPAVMDASMTAPAEAPAALPAAPTAALPPPLVAAKVEATAETFAPRVAAACPALAHARAWDKHCATTAHAVWMIAPPARRVREADPPHGRRGAGRTSALRTSRGPPRRGPPRHARRRSPARGATQSASTPPSREASRPRRAAPPRPSRRRSCAAPAAPAAASRDLMYVCLRYPSSA